MSYLPVPRRRYTGLGQAEAVIAAVGSLVGSGVNIYQQSVAIKHDAAMAKKNFNSQLVLSGEAAKLQAQADAEKNARTNTIIRAVEVVGVGAGFFGLLWLLLGGRKKAGPTSTVLTLPPLPPASPAPVKNPRRSRRRYACLG